MNGPEHYAEAERLTELAESVDWQDGDPDRPAHVEYAQTILAAAQVHATLAHVAAQISDRYRDPTREEFGHSDVDRAFYEVTQ